MAEIAQLSSRISKNSKGVMHVGRMPKFRSLFHDYQAADVNLFTEDEDVGAEIERVMKSFAGRSLAEWLFWQMAGRLLLGDSTVGPAHEKLRASEVPVVQTLMSQVHSVSRQSE
jgi:hypothetical protein